MREQPGIPEEQLRACLQDKYDLFPITLEFLPRGKDYQAGVFRVVSVQSAAYLLKVTSRALYDSRCLVPRYLFDQGITSVVAPIPTRSGALWTKLADWTIIVYPFIEGDSSLTGMTNDQWKKVGAIFKQIHQVVLPRAGFETLRKEAFDPAEYVRWIRTFESQYLRSQHDESEPTRALRDDWLAHQSTIHVGVTTLEKLAGVLQRRAEPYVICHADLHASNLLRDRHGHVFVIDWDEVMLAPKERDFIFIREPHAHAFWEGYGQIKLDWMVLTYYLWERVIQDLIEYAQEVCFRDDLGEDNRAELVQYFHMNLAGKGGTLDAAYAAAAHIHDLY